MALLGALMNVLPTCGGDTWLSTGCPSCPGCESDSSTTASVDDSILVQEIDFVKSPTIPCDPTYCRMSSGICVDCTKCSRHCTCGGGTFHKMKKRKPQQDQQQQEEPGAVTPSPPRQHHHHLQQQQKQSRGRRLAEELEAPPPPLGPNDGGPCNPRECQQVICTDCMRCSEHCICDYYATAEREYYHDPIDPQRSHSLRSLREYAAAYEAERSSSLRSFRSSRRPPPLTALQSLPPPPAPRRRRSSPAPRVAALPAPVYSRHAGRPPSTRRNRGPGGPRRQYY